MGPAGAPWGHPCPALPCTPLLLSGTLGGLGPASFLAWPFSSEPVPECRSGYGSPVCTGYWDGTQQIRQLMKSILEAEVKARQVQGQAWPPPGSCMAVFSRGAGMADRRGAGVPFVRLHPCDLITPEALPLDIVTLGLGFQQRNSGGQSRSVLRTVLLAIRAPWPLVPSTLRARSRVEADPWHFERLMLSLLDKASYNIMIFVCMCFLTNWVLTSKSDVSFSLCLFFFSFYYKQFIFIQHMSIRIDTDVLLTNKTDHFIIALFENI